MERAARVSRRRGFDGLLTPPIELLSPSILSRRYATLTTNGGHDADRKSRDYFNADFAYDKTKLADFTYRSEHRALPVGREIISAFYAAAPRRSYYEGCSMGGHDALLLSQRYPGDFDGIVARAPAGNILGLFAQFNRISNALAVPGGTLTPAKRKLLSDAVRARCDRLDNLADGIVSNPDQCRFRPETLRCEGGADRGDMCLSDQQVATVAAVTTPIAIGGDLISHPGYNFGGEDSAKGWGEYIWPSPALGGASLQRVLFSDGFVRSFVTRDAGFDTTRWNPDDWLPRMRVLARMFQATDPDLGGL